MHAGLQCPSCKARVRKTTKTCPKCRFRIERIDGIIDLRTDKSFDTLLDVDAYAEQHGGSAVKHGLAKLYFDLMELAGRSPGGDILEIASGPGNLTLPLILSGHFQSISASDISLRFLQILDGKISTLSPAPKAVDKYLFDANNFPFRDEQFDFVVGNSVLHHFSNFENSLREARRVLRPGGAAIFGEPIMDSHVFVSLAAGLILRSPQGSGQVLDAKTRQVLGAIQKRASRKMAQLHSDRTNLNHIEDKFVFPVEHLRKLASELGFSRLVTPEPPKGLKFGDMVKEQIVRETNASKVSPSFLEGFSYIFESLNEDYGEPLKGVVRPLFTLFAFLK